MRKRIAEIVVRHIEQGTKDGNNPYINTIIGIIEKAVKGETVTIHQVGDDLDDSQDADTWFILARRLKIPYIIKDRKTLIFNPMNVELQNMDKVKIE